MQLKHLLLFVKSPRRLQWLRQERQLHLLLIAKDSWVVKKVQFFGWGFNESFTKGFSNYA
tara:strand:+ start:159 stop:338 length:180 start_codon:yes stop_codon:yes gene_type:complete